MYYMTDQDDARCVAGCLAGDSGQFEPLVKRYERVLFSVAYRLTGDYEDARDATQNAFVRAFVKLHQFDPAQRFFSWIYRIVVNESLNVKRTRRHAEPLTDKPISSGAFEAVVAHERRDHVQAALMTLTPEYREVLVLRHFAELSYQEISDAIGVPEKTVKSRLFTARERLAAVLGPDR